MRMPFTHPALSQLAELLSQPQHAKDATVLAHVRSCTRCQESLRFCQRVMKHGMEIPEPAPAGDLLARILASRAAGERRLLHVPAGDHFESSSDEAGPLTKQALPGTQRLRRVGMMAAAVLALLVLVVSTRSDLRASTSRSELIVTPPAPQEGATLTVVYKPVSPALGKADSLRLRGRFRTPADDAYQGGIPDSQVVSAAILRKTGDRFTGSFTLPPGVVMASLAVESIDASVVDANDTRLWEVMVHDKGGVPLFDALYQRANEMMGRSWEEAYASARRATELYPGRIGGWTYREFFESAIYSAARAESLGRAYASLRDSLIADARAGAPISRDDIGSVFYRVAVARRSPNATDKDREALAYWWERITREYPKHEQIAQYVAFDFTKEQRATPRFILDSLERAYQHLKPLHGPGFNLSNSAMQAAREVRDAAAERLWFERVYAGSTDSVRAVAMMLAGKAEYRAEGMDALRTLARAPDSTLVPSRSIFWNREEYARRVDQARRRLLAALGEALIANGGVRAGVDTLGLAVEGSWDAQVHPSLLAGFRKAGDSAGIQRMLARLTVDPRTSPHSAALYADEGKGRMGETGWQEALDRETRELHQAVMARSMIKSPRGNPTLVDSRGIEIALNRITDGKPAVVVFWSRDCGWALQALPEIARVAGRLDAAGTPVIMVNTTADTAGVAEFLTKGGWKLPVYYDARGTMTEGFSNFGIPAYYVLDRSGRIRFDRVEDVQELITLAAAVR